MLNISYNAQNINTFRAIYIILTTAAHTPEHAIIDADLKIYAMTNQTGCKKLQDLLQINPYLIN